MYLSPDDARTDVILAAAAAVLGGFLRGFVMGLPLYPTAGTVVASVLDVVWILALTAVIPILLARYRGDGLAAFGLGGASGGLAVGLPLALPAVVLGVSTLLWIGWPPGAAVLGRLAQRGPAPFDAVIAGLVLAHVAAFTIGTLVLVGFLSTRAREAFPRSPEASLTALVRTIGMGAAVAALVLGTLRALTGQGFVGMLLHVAALATVILLVDRLVPAGITLHRSTIVAVLVVVLVANVFAGGGLFRGDLLGALYRSTLAVATIVPIAALGQTARGAWPAVPLALAVHWWPTCLSPLVLATSSLC